MRKGRGSMVSCPAAVEGAYTNFAKLQHLDVGHDGVTDQRRIRELELLRKVDRSREVVSNHLVG